MQKYKNKKCNGFDSQKEYHRFLRLKLEQERGEISDLKTQVAFKFILNNILICSYKSDFTYMKNGVMVVEDVKSKFTAKLPVYRIKRKLMKAFYNIDIVEVI